MKIWPGPWYMHRVAYINRDAMQRSGSSYGAVYSTVALVISGVVALISLT